MAIESGVWQDQSDWSLSQEVKLYEAARDEKRAHQIGEIFDRILTLATDPRGLTRVDGNIDDFDFSTVLRPRRHRPGHIREGLFENGLYVRATTASKLTDSLHRLLLHTDGRPHEYQVVGLNAHSEVDVINRDAVGIEEIATVPNVLYNLGKIEATFEVEQSKRWPQALSASDLRHAYRPCR